MNIAFSKLRNYHREIVGDEKRQAKQSTSFQQYVGDAKRCVRAKRKSDLNKDTSDLRRREVSVKIQERERVRERSAIGTE
jgi:hypothetical protein